MEARGLRAYEQARAYERLRPWRLPVTLSLFPVLAAGTALGLARLGYGAVAAADLGGAVILAWLAWQHGRHLATRHAENVRLLRELEAEHGEELPWVRMERHFAQLGKLQDDLVREKSQ